MVAGNGGSYADAEHFAGELQCTYVERQRNAISAISLPQSLSAITAWSNDFEYESFLARQVDAFGSKVPLSQVSAISVPESRMLAVQVWDNSLISVVENAIRTANLGLNPMTEGNLIRLPIPDLTEERRKEIAKLASKYSEDTKISVRNVRRDAMDHLKESEKNKEISKDELFQYSDQIQKLTDKIILLIDELFYEKEKDILQI